MWVVSCHVSCRVVCETQVPEGNLHPFLAVGDENEKEPFGLAPDDQSIALLDEIYAALLPNFSSRQFNVGASRPLDD